LAAAATTDDPWSNSFIEHMREEEGGGMGIEQTRKDPVEMDGEIQANPPRKGKKNVWLPK
jgi:hypothetical protein